MNNYNFYNFDPEECFNSIKQQFMKWFANVQCENVVLGISGGKDSTVCAYLLAKILGPEHVYGVMMPNGIQKDISDSMEVIKLTKINSYAVNIHNVYDVLLNQLKYNGISIKTDTEINTPPRLRMTTLYAIAQSINAIVINTDNLCERVLGYSTLWGDSVGSYAPIQNLTVPEVIELGKWLGAPAALVEKTPGDGLQELGDEARLGVTYKEVHNLIRFNISTSETFNKINAYYNKNKFKLEMINLPGPAFDLPNFIFN